MKPRNNNRVKPCEMGILTQVKQFAQNLKSRLVTSQRIGAHQLDAAQGEDKSKDSKVDTSDHDNPHDNKYSERIVRRNLFPDKDPDIRRTIRNKLKLKNKRLRKEVQVRTRAPSMHGSFDDVRRHISPIPEPEMSKLRNTCRRNGDKSRMTPAVGSKSKDHRSEDFVLGKPGAAPSYRILDEDLYQSYHVEVTKEQEQEEEDKSEHCVSSNDDLNFTSDNFWMSPGDKDSDISFDSDIAF